MKLRPGEVEQISQGHLASKWQIQDCRSFLSTKYLSTTLFYCYSIKQYSLFFLSNIICLMLFYLVHCVCTPACTTFNKYLLYFKTLLLKKLNFFYWCVIALPCCVSFCCITAGMSCIYTYIPSFLGLPPTHTPSRPLGHHRAPNFLCYTADSHQLPIFHMVVCIYIYLQRRQWQPTPVLLPGKSHGWRSLVGCSP